MNTYLKIASTKATKNCNCISPFYIDNISGINPNTNREYSSEDKDILKTALYRISNAKGCDISVCCDPNDPTALPDAAFTKQFLQKFPKIMPMYNGSTLTSIKLSTTANVAQSGWIVPEPYMICKITKATIQDTSDPTIKNAVNLVNDCFTDQCNQAETITMNNLLQNTKADMKYTYIDDARVTQAIRDGNIAYVKQYIRQYKQINIALTNDDYNNRMIHIASESKNNSTTKNADGSSAILNMLIALQADINITNKLHETPMHFAIRAKNLNNIDTLLAQNADLSIANNNGETAMFYAMKTGDMRIINMIYNGGSGVLYNDSKGNNLIHYCIINCPTYKDADPNTTNISNTDIVSNSKSEIIKFLIDHGVSTEQKNNAGISPLELVSKNINKEINKKCASNKANEKATIVEAFFNIKPIREAFNSSGGVSKQDLKKDTIEHNSLLEVQTMLFNNIIKNNPSKYNNYISVDDVPVGAPIEILDTVCVGASMTGNEDNEECIAKGGQIVKINNKTTKIKIELYADDDETLDAINQNDLYFNKTRRHKPIATLPLNLQTYNNSLNINNTISVPQTTGITYTIGQDSTNTIGQDSTNTIASSSIATSVNTVPLVTPNVASLNTIPFATSIVAKHPPLYDDEVLHKCQADAILNSTKITKSNTTIPNTTAYTLTNSASIVARKYSTELIVIFSIIIALLIGISVYKRFLV